MTQKQQDKEFLDGLNVLYLDDDLQFAEQFIPFIARRVKSVRHELNAKDGLNAFAEFRPDIILTDVIMPSMDGLAMAEEIHCHQPDIPIIVMTADDNIALLQRATDINVAAYLVKPINPELLYQKLLANVGSLRKAQELRLAHEQLEAELILHRRDTATLENLQAELKMQQYALDQHSIVAITNVKGDITYVNDKFCDISKYSRDELIGKNHRILNSDYHPASFFKEMWRTIASGKVWHGEIKNIDKEGAIYWVDTTIVPYLNTHGEPTQYVAIRTDITQRKAEQFELKQAKNEALTASKIKSEFLIKMSREIRTPLNGVIGMAELLEDSPLQPYQREYTNTIVASASSLLSIANNILDFLKIESDRLELHTDDFEFSEVIESVAELIAPLVRQKDLSLMSHIDTAIPPMLIGDSGRLRQVLVNLVSNAVKFTDQGEVIIDVTLEQKQDNAVIVKLKVSDTGIGLPQQFISTLFDPFIQADRSTTRHYDGTGLGLSICKRFVEFMGGEIGVESVEGQGSTFWFTLPFAISPKIPAISYTINGNELHGIRVLVVDDSHTNREIIKHYLQSWGAACLTAESGKEALSELHNATINNNPIQLVIIDLAMREIDNYELAERIKQDKKYVDLPMVMLTASTQVDQEKIALSKGFSAFFNKPVRRAHLFEGLCRVIRSKSVNKVSPANTDTNHTLNNQHTQPVSQPSLSPTLLPILLVEDNIVNQKVANCQLVKLGYKVDIANNGQEAVEMLRTSDYALVLMDCQMPVLDGYDATKQIRQDEQAASKQPAIIIAMTANTMESDRQNCLASGMNDFLAKPILKETLQSMLAKWLPESTVSEKSSISDNEEADLHHKDAIFNTEIVAALHAEIGDLIGEVASSYLTDTPELLEHLHHAVQANDLDQVKLLTHTLKSSSLQLGMTGLGNLAAELEKQVRSSGEICSHQELEQLQRLFKQGAAELADYAQDAKHEPNLKSTDNNATVLVVDDDATTRIMLRRVMEADGYHVEEAHNGEQAVALFRSVQPEIILMDCMMPVMNGFDACKKIHATPEGANTSVLMITGLNDDVTIQRAISSGAADFISKPIYLPVLSQRVKHLIEMKRAQEHVKHIAYHDVLTGLPNRMLFNDRLQAAIKATKRNVGRLAVMFLDLDHFKKVNDSLGHAAGDKLLQMVAVRIKGLLRDSDTLSRMGGDEFTILFPDLGEGEEGIRSLQTIATKIIHSLTEPFMIEGHKMFIGTSIGASLCPDDSDDPYSLLKNADAAMYNAKANGRNAFSLFCTSMNNQINEYIQLENGLRNAIKQDELHVYYQPQMNMIDNRIDGMEALIRWQHPELGMVSPAKFIPIAEESGLILSIGKWVLEQACQQCKKWHEMGLEHITVSVNLSAKQFQSGNLLEDVIQALESSGLPASALGLEITESITMHDGDDVIKTLRALKNIGINKISMDDFGTGYSSLSYLKLFPIDVIKIDQSFVRDINRDANDDAIVETIIAMANSLKLDVIAEGVENQQQLDFLQQHQCHIIQGYFISKPLPADELISLLRH
ncbi:MAG: response regulator [Gammaproteobacteria bacterium]|nr:response regulator [Gammaproteobacteria bacterium]